MTISRDIMIHVEDIMTTLGSIQCIGGIDIMSTCTLGYHQMFCALEVFHDFCGDTMSHVRDVQYIGGISWVH